MSFSQWCYVIPRSLICCVLCTGICCESCIIRILLTSENHLSIQIAITSQFSLYSISKFALTAYGVSIYQNDNIQTSYCSGGTMLVCSLTVFILSEMDYFRFILIVIDQEKISRAKSFSEKQASEYLNTIIEAVHYMHTLDIVHRDLKGMNQCSWLFPLSLTLLTTIISVISGITSQPTI